MATFLVVPLAEMDINKVCVFMVIGMNLETSCSWGTPM